MRYDKVVHAIQKEVSSILHDEMKDPRLGFVTIVRVELSKDFRHAKIFYSVLGKEKDLEKTKEALESAQGFIRKLVAERVNLKFAPELLFREDHSTEYSVKIQEIIDSVKEKDEKRKGVAEKDGPGEAA
jgi:ribosome-binding factor A